MSYSDFDADENDDFEQLSDSEPALESSKTTSTRRGLTLKARAVDFLSRREHSRVELRRKLQRHSDNSEEIDDLLDDLAKENWQSDERYAQSHLNRRAYKFGTRRVVQELRQNGVSDEHINSVREQLKETEFDRAFEVWERKFGAAPTDQKTYAKQHRFMASRGFSPDLLRRILDRFSDSL